MKNFNKILLSFLGSCILLSGCGNERVVPEYPLSPPEEDTTEVTTEMPTGHIVGEYPITTSAAAIIPTTVTTSAEGTQTVTATVTGTKTKSKNESTTTTTKTAAVGHTASNSPTSVSNNSNPGSNNNSGSNSNSNNTPSQQQENTEPQPVQPEEPETPPENNIDLRNYSSPHEMVDNMSLQEKVCQMFIVSPEQLGGAYPTTGADEEMQNTLYTFPVGGVVFFDGNLESSSQTQTLISSLQDYSYNSIGAGLFTAIDEEGGSVSRAAQKLGTASFYDMSVYGEDNNADTARTIGYVLGTELHNLGFNLDFAPVSDVMLNSENTLGNRIFSSNPDVVANMASNFALGLQSAGVSATLKHFPGLGSGTGVSYDNSFEVIDRTIDQLFAEELVPFSSGINAGVDFVMAGHQIITGCGDNLPSDLSYTAVTTLLRNELGFNGLVITDAHNTNAIKNVYGSGNAAVMAVKAGVDIILLPDNLSEAVSAVCNAVGNGEITTERIDESVIRILSKKQSMGLIN